MPACWLGCCMEKLKSKLSGGIICNSLNCKYRIIEIRNNGSVILKNTKNQLVQSKLTAIQNFNLKYDLEFE